MVSKQTTQALGVWEEDSKPFVEEELAIEDRMHSHTGICRKPTAPAWLTIGRLESSLPPSVAVSYKKDSDCWQGQVNYAYLRTSRSVYMFSFQGSTTSVLRRQRYLLHFVVRFLLVECNQRVVWNVFASLVHQDGQGAEDQPVLRENDWGEAQDFPSSLGQGEDIARLWIVLSYRIAAAWVAVVYGVNVSSVTWFPDRKRGPPHRIHSRNPFLPHEKVTRPRLEI